MARPPLFDQAKLLMRHAARRRGRDARPGRTDELLGQARALAHQLGMGALEHEIAQVGVTRRAGYWLLAVRSAQDSRKFCPV